MKERDGFTLVELIVVMAIIVLLAGIAVPSYLGYIQKAKEQQNIVDARQMRIAIAAMMMEQGIDSEQVADNEMYMSIFWRKIGDPKHPLYGACPGHWDPEGTISEMSVDEEFRLVSIIYQDPGGFQEIWYITDEEGALHVEVVK